MLAQLPCAARGYALSMLIIGAVLAVIAVVLIVFGFVGTAVQWLLWIGIALMALAVILILVDRSRLRR